MDRIRVGKSGAARCDRLADIVGRALELAAVARLIGLARPRIG